MRQVTIYREPGRFAGWPANYGIWRWGNEIVVGFTVGARAHKTVERGHARDKSQPINFINRQARSFDGGESWQIEPFKQLGSLPAGRGLSADEHSMDAGSCDCRKSWTPMTPPSRRSRWISLIPISP